MSVVVTMAATGAVMVAAPVLAGIAATAAAALGLKALSEAELDARIRRELELHAETTVEIAVTTATAAALTEVVAERSVLWFGDGRVTLRVARDIRGRLSVQAKGDGVPRHELEATARRLVGLIQQQVAYRSVMVRLKAEGFQVDEEARLEDGSAKIRLKLRR